MIRIKKGMYLLKDGSLSLTLSRKITKCASRMAIMAIKASQPRNANNKT